MNLSETADLLTAMAAFDRRTIGDGDVIAWQAILFDASFEDCLEAVKDHYAEHTEWMMPAHVRRLVRDIIRQREAAARHTGWAPGQAGVPKDQALPEAPSGERLALSDLPAAVADLVARVRADLPEGSRETLMPRRVAWEREHAAYLRTRDAKPNPFYLSKAAADPARDSDGFYIADYHPDAALKPKVACDWHEEGGFGWSWTCRRCNPDRYLGAVPGYGADGCDCLPEKVSESCPLHGFKPNPSDQ